MNIAERYESFVRDVKNYFPDSFSILSTFLYIFMLKRYERALVGLGTFNSTCQN